MVSPLMKAVKQFFALFKKLKREFAGKNPGDIMQQCKQLLPLPSLSHSVFTVSPVSDTPGTSGQATDKLPSSGGTSCQGLQITGKQRISAWDLMEGSKNPSPLSWAWFGAVRIERKPLRYEQDFRRLLHHTHPRRRPLSYFLNPSPDKEDEQDEEEESTEADAVAVDRSNQPSTPQTPADSRGMTPSAIPQTMPVANVASTHGMSGNVPPNQLLLRQKCLWPRKKQRRPNMLNQP